MSRNQQTKQSLEVIIEYERRPTNMIECIQKKGSIAVSLTVSVREQHTLATINDKSSYINMFNIVPKGSAQTNNFIVQSLKNLQDKYSAYYLDVYSADEQLIAMLKSNKKKMKKNIDFNIIDFAHDRIRAAVSYRVKKQTMYNFDNIVATPVKKTMEITKRNDENVMNANHVLSPFHKSKKKFTQHVHVATDASVRDKHSASVCITEDMKVLVSEDHGLLQSDIAELEAIGLAVRTLASPDTHLVVHTDSKGAIDRLYNQRKLQFQKANAIIRDIYNIVDSGCTVSVTYVKGHSGNHMNSAADYAARCARMLASGDIDHDEFNQKIERAGDILNARDILFSVPKKVVA